MDWTDWIKSRDMSGAFVNSVMKLQVLLDAENIQTRILVHVVNWLAIDNVNKLSFLNNNNNNVNLIFVLYRVIHKFLRDFRTRLRNNQDRHGRKEHINR